MYLCLMMCSSHPRQTVDDCQFCNSHQLPTATAAPGNRRPPRYDHNRNSCVVAHPVPVRARPPRAARASRGRVDRSRGGGAVDNTAMDDLNGSWISAEGSSATGTLADCSDSLSSSFEDRKSSVERSAARRKRMRSAVVLRQQVMLNTCYC